MFTRALMIITLLCVTSCGSSSDAPNESASYSPRIALVMKSLANEFFKTMEDSARAYHEENSDSFSFIANGIKNEEDVSGQIALVEQMIAQEVDAIVIAPANSQALIPVLKQAKEKGIVVINIDNKLDDSTLEDENIQIPFIGPDNRMGAKLAGDQLAKSLSSGDPVAIIGGIPSAFNSIQRVQGFEDSMKAAGMNVIESQAGNWEMAKANQVASGIITEHPDLKAILCANDNMVLGAVSAIRDAGKEDTIKVCGYDNISAVQALVKEGKVDCTIDQHGDKLAIYGIEYALEILNGGVSPSDRETPVDLVTADTLQ